MPATTTQHWTMHGARGPVEFVVHINDWIIVKATCAGRSAELTVYGDKSVGVGLCSSGSDPKWRSFGIKPSAGAEAAQYMDVWLGLA